MQLKTNSKNIQIEKRNLDGIPVCFAKPERILGIALWIPYLGGTCETCLNDLHSIAMHDFLAISLDPWMHGERGKTGKPSIREQALKHFRAVMWQVLGLTVLDCYKIVDWASSEFGIAENIVVGGLSMGGDIAISLAGIDKRIKRVAGVASSPDWNRNGMTEVMDSEKTIDQGNASDFSRWLCEKLNPIDNVKNYEHSVMMQLEYGKKDSHIKSEWGFDFKRKVDSTEGDQKIMILNSEESTHISLIQKKSVINRAIHFLVD